MDTRCKKDLIDIGGIYYGLSENRSESMEGLMETAKIFQNGRSQKEVFISREGSKIILSEKPDSWEEFFSSDKRPTSDFMQNREQLTLEERDIL